MRSLVRGTAVLVLLSVVASCSGLLKKGGDDAGGPETSVVEVAEAAAPVPAPAALATNEGDVARFPDEVAIANEAAILQRSYNVREAPPAGAIVAGLGKGTSVTKIASRDRYFLILFEKTPGTKTMGWVHKDAFSAVIQDAGPLVCPTGEIALFGDTPFCGRLCSADKDCPTNQACKGQANKLLPTGKAGDGVTVCTAFHPHDGGAPPPPPPPPPDAGRPVDAGAPKVDSGPAPGPAPAQDVVPATNGACPANFLLVKKTGKCHRPCPNGPASNDCKNATKFCIKCDNDTKKVCADNRDQCK
jgi:hypothetical protein